MYIRFLPRRRDEQAEISWIRLKIRYQPGDSSPACEYARVCTYSHECGRGKLYRGRAIYTRRVYDVATQAASPGGCAINTRARLSDKRGVALVFRPLFNVNFPPWVPRDRYTLCVEVAPRWEQPVNGGWGQSVREYKGEGGIGEAVPGNPSKESESLEKMRARAPPNPSPCRSARCGKYRLSVRAGIFSAIYEEISVRIGSRGTVRRRDRDRRRDSHKNDGTR